MPLARSIRPVGAAVLWGLLLVASPAAADVITIEPSADATLHSEDEKKANGSGAYVFAGNTDGGDQRRTVLAFDVAGALPMDATINSVSLQLHVSRTQVAGTRTVELRTVLSSWTEGPSNPGGQEGGGDSAEAGDVTWLYRSYDPNDEQGAPKWITAGGDFSGTASASTNVGGEGFYTWSSAQMDADVAAWYLDPTSNFGWLLKDVSNGGSGTAKRYDSRQNNSVNERPKLTIDYSVTQPTGACCEDGFSGVCGVTAGAGACAGTYLDDGSVCTPNPCATGCCLPNAQAQCVEVDEASCLAQGGTPQGAACGTVSCPVVLTPFLDPLPIPAVAQPVTGSAGAAAHYQMTMRQVQQQLHAELPPTTTVYGFGDGPSGATYPGPTIEADVDQRVTVDWINSLPTTHHLAVDTCPHGAMQFDDGHAIVHLHGAHTADEWDGHPDDAYPPGQQLTFEYPNDQLPATLWYHDHTLGLTRLNVYMGLAGFYLLRDATEQGLNLPSGSYEVPLAIQDRSFNPDGSLQYPPVWQGTFFGDQILVNGKVWPYLDVDRGKYRLRVLNGSSSRTYALALSNGASFQQIGAEGGLLPAPVTMNQITLGSGERADIVVDFAPYAAGTEIELVNSAPAPFPGSAGVGVVPQVMKFVVQAASGDTDPVPPTLRAMEVLQEADATVSREFHLLKTTPRDTCSPFVWVVRSIGAGGVNLGQWWEDITERPQLGATEIWEFVNLSGMTHPMHMHLVMFQVLDRQAFDNQGTAENPVIVPIGGPAPPPPHEAGWKDTVQVGPNEIVRVIARFTNPLDPTGPTYVGDFPYHCHILEHEDHEMMRQFVSETTCGDGIPGLPLEQCDDGGTAPGDGCSPTCQIDECSNGVDDDGDALLDGADPGCGDGPGDLSENSPTLVCDDGLDNDGDGLSDFPADLSCTGVYDPTEGDPEIQAPTSFDFGSVAVGSTLTLDLQVQNVGNARLRIRAVSSSNKPIFRPLTNGITVASLGLLGLLLLLPAAALPRRRVGRIAVTLGLVLLLALVSVSEAARRRSALNVLVPPGQSAFIPIEFTPAAAVGYSETLTIRSDDTDKDPLAVTLLGSGS